MIRQARAHNPLFVLVVIAILAATAAADEQLTLDYDRDHMSLNGQWEKLTDHPDAEVWKKDVAAEIDGWEPVAVPGRMPPKQKGANERALKTHCFWIGRTFTLTEAQTARDVVLKWNGIRFGATGWINGQEITRHPTIGPHTTLIPRNVLKAGENRIVIRINAWASLPKAAKFGRNKIRFPLIPTGASICAWGSKLANVFGDVYLEFYDRVYMKWALAMPDISAKTVTFRIRLDSIAELPASATISVKVTPVAPGATAAGVAEKQFQTDGAVSGTLDITVPVTDARLWTPQTPNLYQAELELRTNGRICDTVRFRFGMREIRVVKGRYQLNGKPVWFRGSSLLGEWNWGPRFKDMDLVKRYLVTEAKQVNVNCFRTHAQPPPASWANLADENGIMLLAELPVLRNYMDFPWTKKEFDAWHENVLIDAPGWITKLWNHPSIVMWVISNETLDGEWENGPYRDMVVALDPTRPTMRTGHQGEVKGTADILHPLRSGTPVRVTVTMCWLWRREPEGYARFFL